MARAPPAGLDYPSGHVTRGHYDRRPHRARRMPALGLVGGLDVLGPFAVAITASMAITVIRPHFHYVTDTPATALVACGTAAAVALLVSLGENRLPSGAAPTASTAAHTSTRRSASSTGG